MHGEMSAITYQQRTWLEEIRNEARHNPKLSSIKKVMQKGTHNALGLVERDGLLWNKGHLVLLQNSPHREAMIQEFHDTHMGGYSAMFRTYKRIASNFY